MGIIDRVKVRKLLSEVHRLMLVDFLAVLFITISFKVIILLAALQKRVVWLTGMTIQHLAELSCAVHGVLCNNIRVPISFVLSQLRIPHMFQLRTFELLGSPMIAAKVLFYV